MFKTMNTRPQCIIVTGRPGSGKTTLAGELGHRLWLPVVSRDQIKEGYVNTFGVKHDQLPPETNGVVTEFFFSVVEQYLVNNVSVIIEAAFQHHVWEPRVKRIGEVSRPFLVACSVAADLAAQRHLQRGLADPCREFYHGDRRVAIYRETGTVTPGNYVTPEFDLPTAHISTEGDYSPSLDELVQQIRHA